MPIDATFDALAFTPAPVAVEELPSPWSKALTPTPYYQPNFYDNDILKQDFGVELGKGLEPFKAALEVFNQELPKSLWVSTNWLSDPIVIAAKDIYIKTVKSLQKPLDKEELLAKVLSFADEKDSNGRPLVEAKERLNALKLYSDIQGFTGKVSIDASTNTTNNTNNLMKIVLVKGSKSDNQNEHASNIKSEMTNDIPAGIQLKLVGGSAR